VAVRGSLGGRDSNFGMEMIDRRREQLLEASRAQSTIKIYKSLFDEFVSFAKQHDLRVLPAEESLVERFVSWLDLMGKGGRARAALAAVSWAHVLEGCVDPTKNKRIKLLLEGVEREWSIRGKKQFRRDPFPIEALRHCVRRKQGDWWLRDACLVALGLRTMRRASELTALRVEDVQWIEDISALRVYIRRSKVDQAGRGFECFVEPTETDCCPVKLLRMYLEHRGSRPGYLFTSATGGKLSVSAVSSICKRMVEAAGLDAQVSSHSLRIGGATAAMMAGITREQIMTIGGWSSSAVDRYLRAAEVTRLGVSVKMGF